MSKVCIVGSSLLATVVYILLVGIPALLIIWFCPALAKWIIQFHVPWWIWTPSWVVGIWLIARRYFYPHCKKVRS